MHTLLHHYTKVTVVRVCVRDLRAGGDRKPFDPRPKIIILDISGLGR